MGVVEDGFAFDKVEVVFFSGGIDDSVRFGNRVI